MSRILLGIVVGAFAFYAWQRVHEPASAPAPADAPAADLALVERPEPVASEYHCDGRTHCSQMRSCDEATYFLRHCPDAKMDGNNDGVPCEKQWCGR